MGSGLLGIHHVGIAVEDLDAAIDHYQRVLGATLDVRAFLPEQGVEAASLYVGAGIVELIAPRVGSGGVARFLQRRGPGLHHVAWSVADLGSELRRLAAAGVRLVDEQPRAGLHGTPVAFVHPAGMNGVLTELVQVATGSTHDGGN